MKSIKLLTFFFYLLHSCVESSYSFAQDSILAPTLINYQRLKRSETRNAQTLANRLTAGKTSEKERFDALFTWVVMHIHYDYRKYNSGNAFQYKSIRKILRSRKGICTDYSHLMDTLCYFAGIENTTILGYVKELNFDLNDSLYFDNHAWNAVKLNGAWYLYDPTWCSGHTTYDYTKFGKWRIRTKNRLAKKTTVKNRFLVTKQPKNAYCDEEKTIVLKSFNVSVIRWFPRLLIRIIDFPKYRLKEKYVAVANTNYYLSNPEYFAVTHFPNDPTWSFSQRILNTSAFSADSNFYDRSKIKPEDRQRKGTFCLDCDDFLMGDSLKREQIIYSQSLINNSLNQFVPANYHHYLINVLYKKVLNTSDSLQKMQWIDSTYSVIKIARSELKASRTNSKKEANFQLKKNKDKKAALLKENKQYISAANKINNNLSRKYHRIRSLKYKTKSYELNQNNFKRKFNRSFRKELVPKKMTDENKLKLQQQVNSNLHLVDSFSSMISALQERFVTDASQLWNNLLDENQNFYPMENAYANDNSLRLYYVMDNYDLWIQNLRKSIATSNQQWQQSIQKSILNLSDSIYNEYVLLLKLLKTRNSYAYKAAQQLRTLYQVGIGTKENCTSFKVKINQLIKDEQCWNSTYGKINKDIYSEFKFIKKDLQDYIHLIYRNNRIEERRYKIHYRHISRNKARQLDAIQKNGEQVNKTMKALVQHKKEFLLEWRKTH